MPVVKIRLEKMLKLLDINIPVEDLVENLASLGLSCEEVTDGQLRVEYNPNRPDFSSIYGIARALKGFLDIETGLPKHPIKRSKIIIYVDSSVADVRPFIAGAVVKGLKLEAEDLEELIAMQEDLHWILGRNRRKMAIGLHDISAISPPFTYKAVGPNEVLFTPLKDFRKMTPAEVLVKNEIGRRYAHLVANYPKYPVIVDSRGEVFSMPPIVNAALTELTPGLRNVFIDVTGTELEKVEQALNILVTAMADAGGEVYKVKVVYENLVRTTPEMKPRKMALDINLVSSLTGLDMSPSEVVKLLRKMRMSARISKGRIEVGYPAYRVDILHPVDLVEDISIAYGYNKMVPERPVSNTYGKLLPQTELLEKLSEIMIGLGYMDVHNLMLTNESIHYESMLMDEEPHVRLANPATREYTMVRTSLLPSLLTTLALNKDNLYPQRIFEIGDVVVLDSNRPERTVRYKRLAAATAHSEADYTEMKSVLDELFRLLNLKPSYKPAEVRTFIAGRCASLWLADRMVGVAGEISPQVLENFGITMPVAAAEIKLEEIF